MDTAFIRTLFRTLTPWFRAIALSWRPVAARTFVTLVPGRDYGYE